MAAIHFFTDTDLFTAQTNDIAYGPVKDAENTDFNLCSSFTVSSPANAYAAFDGTVFVQPVTSNAELVNILLYPIFSHKTAYSPAFINWGLPRINYIIYRGIRKDSIFNSSGEIIGLDQTGNTEFTQYISEKFLKFNESGNAPSSTVGFNYSSLPDSDLIEKILFLQDADIQFPIASQGMIIGKFSGNSTCAFQVVLEDNLYFPSLGMLRSEEHSISVPEPLSGILPGNESFDIMRQREEILNYMDPAILYMTLEDLGVAYKTSSSDVSEVKGIEDVYNTIVSKFYTKNKLYIDIRNENGYSLNLYKDNQGQPEDADFGKHLQINIQNAGAEKINYYTNFWPILIADLAANSATDKNEVLLSFRKDYCNDLILYIDFGSRNEDFPFIATGNKKWLEENNTNSWSNYFQFAVPNTTAIPDSPVGYIKLFYIRNEIVGTPPVTALKRDKDFDNLFSLWKEFPDFGTNKYIWGFSLGKKYFNAVNRLGIAGIAETVVQITDTEVWFYARICDYYNYLDSDNRFVNNMTELNTELDTQKAEQFVKEIYEEKGLDRMQVKILAKKPLLDQESGLGSIQRISLGITKSEYLEILSTAAALPNTFELFLQFENFEFKVDRSERQFIESTLRIAGLQSDGTYTSFRLSPKVYTLLYQTFTSFLLGDNLDIEEAKDSFFTADELIQMVKEFEKAYSADTPGELLTRIRVHFYGYPGQAGNLNGERKAYVFNLAVPNSPYYESSPLCFPDDVPPALLERLGCTIRMLKKPDASSDPAYREAYNRLTRRLGGETMDRYNDTETAVLVDGEGYFVDIGHALFGLDALVTASPDGKPSDFYSDPATFDIDYSIDLASFIGDIAWGLASAYVNDSNPTTALNAKFIQGAPSVDLYGDADIYGLKAAWDELNTATSGDFKLSDVLTAYYNGTGANSYTNRWKNFALTNHLIRNTGGTANDGYIWDENQLVDKTDSATQVPIYDLLKDRILRLGQFAYYANNQNLKGNIELFVNAVAYPIPLSGDFNTIDFEATDIDIILRKFLNFVQEKLEEEQKWNL